MGEGAWDFNENIPTYGIKVLSNEQYNSYHHETVFPDGYIILTYSQYLLTHPLYTSAPPPPPGYAAFMHCDKDSILMERSSFRTADHIEEDAYCDSNLYSFSGQIFIFIKNQYPNRAQYISYK